MSSVEESMSALSFSSYNYDGPILRGQRCQSFALPKNIIYYMAMNPSSSKVYMKLIQTCKFFYNINPIFVVEKLGFRETEFKSGEYVWEVAIKEYECAPFYKIDMDKIPFKIWITKFVWIRPYNEMYETVTTLFVQRKLFRSEATDIVLDGQVLTLNEFALLSSKAKTVDFNGVTITENDGKDEEVMFEKIIEKLPNLREINCEWTDSCQCFSTNTVYELLKIPHFGDITSFSLYSIPNELFDAKAFFDYVKICKNMIVDLAYSVKPSVRFKKQIEEIVDEVLATQVFTYKPPCIFYYGFVHAKWRKMREISYRYDNTQF